MSIYEQWKAMQSKPNSGGFKTFEEFKEYWSKSYVNEAEQKRMDKFGIELTSGKRRKLYDAFDRAGCCVHDLPLDGLYAIIAEWERIRQ
jgi:hypothetical protein